MDDTEAAVQQKEGDGKETREIEIEMEGERIVASVAGRRSV